MKPINLFWSNDRIIKLMQYCNCEISSIYFVCHVSVQNRYYTIVSTTSFNNFTSMVTKSEIYAMLVLSVYLFISVLDGGLEPEHESV